MHQLTLPPDFSPCSLLSFLSERLALEPRKLRDWIQAGHVLVDGSPGKAGRYLQPGQTVSVSPPPPSPHPALPEALELPIVYVDADLVVVNKPAGMATHPGPGWWRGSCVNALLHALDWPGISGVAGPGIVHRLDRDTSGLLIFARSQAAHRALLTAMNQREIKRVYLAWVTGTVTGSGQIDAPLGRDPEAPERVIVRPDGKPALTYYQVLESGVKRSLLVLRLETGRTHQIRVHLAQLGHPVWGDPVYGEAEPPTDGSPSGGLALHAWQLSFRHPLSGETLDFCVPPPPAWQALGPLPEELFAFGG